MEHLYEPPSQSPISGRGFLRLNYWIEGILEAMSQSPISGRGFLSDQGALGRPYLDASQSPIGHLEKPDMKPAKWAKQGA